ncbi:hypothetical protein [Nocardia cyriacigeorgica]
MESAGHRPYALPKISTAIAGPGDERIPALAGTGGVWAGTNGKDGYGG